MRQIVLDTETTGLNPQAGNRILEIGCIEIKNRKITNHNFHAYINPERESEEGALRIHGITNEFLAKKPKFVEIINEFKNFIQDAQIIIHNAPFDLSFLNAEFSRLNAGRFEDHVNNIIDTLVQAKERYPGKRNSLDALCDRLGISNKHRKLHGALLDAELLAEVYLTMTRGQNSLVIDEQEKSSVGAKECIQNFNSFEKLNVLLASDAEQHSHLQYLNQLEQDNKGAPSHWQKAADIKFN